MRRRETSSSAPPASDSTRLSVTSCRARRDALAPIAARTVSSRCRATPRARKRFATLAHAISSTQPTPAANTSRAGRMPAVISSTIPRTCTTGGPPTPKSRLAAIGADRVFGRPSLPSAARPGVSVTPGRMRATALSTLICPDRPATASGDGRRTASGVQYSTSGDRETGIRAARRRQPPTAARWRHVDAVRPTIERLGIEALAPAAVAPARHHGVSGSGAPSSG